MDQPSKFSIKQPISPKGREVKGLRGLTGMPTHPALVHWPLAAYTFTAVFDLVSRSVHGGHEELARQMFIAGTWVMLGGAAVAVLAAITGFADWLNTESGTQVRRTANTHALIMVAVTLGTIVDLVLRLGPFRNDEYTPLGVVILSCAIGASVLIGGAYGGALAYEHGFNVAAAATTAAWEPSVIDLTTKELEETKHVDEPEQSSDAGSSQGTVLTAHRRTTRAPAPIPTKSTASKGVTKTTARTPAKGTAAKSAPVKRTPAKRTPPTT